MFAQIAQRGGRFALSALESKSWKHKSAAGAFTASGAVLQFHEIAIKLEPMGTLGGSASIDLELPDSVSAELQFDLIGGDLYELSQWATLPEGSVTGRLDFSGKFSGRMRP